MKKLLLPLILSILLMFTAHAQDSDQNQVKSQEIEMKLNFWGYKFTKDGQRLSWKELEEATTAVENANALIKKARTQHTISAITSAVGGFMIGWPIGQSISDQDPNWELAYIGGGIAVVGIPFTFGAFNNVNKGIDLYNLSVSPTAQYQFRPEFEVIANGKGLGLSMRF